MSNFLFRRLLPILLISAVTAVAVLFAKSKGLENEFDFNKQIWIFYSSWWGNTDINSQFSHWRIKTELFRDHIGDPSVEIDFSLFPKLGLYSSHDESILRQHCKMIKECGIDAIIFEWWGVNNTDFLEPNDTGFSTKTLRMLFDVVSDYDLKIGICIQSYINQTRFTLSDDIKYIYENYIDSPNLLKLNDRPVIIIPQIIPNIHKTISDLKNQGIDPFLISAISERYNIGEIVEDGFSSLISFFGSGGFSWISNSSHWEYMAYDSEERGILFIPTVSPGFHSKKVYERRINVAGNRNSGRLYNSSWEFAISTDLPIVAINSFNNWTDSTNIEPPLNMDGHRFNEKNWLGNNSDEFGFLDLTRYWSHKFKSC